MINLITYCLEKYDIFFNKYIVYLLTKFHLILLMKIGNPFWGSTKIIPHLLDFWVKDEMIYQINLSIIERIWEMNLKINDQEIINNSFDLYKNIKLKQDKIITKEEKIELIDKIKIRNN